MNSLLKQLVPCFVAFTLSINVFGAEDENADWFKEFGDKEVSVKYSRLAGRKIALINIVNEDVVFKDGPTTGSVPVTEVTTNKEVFFVMDNPTAWSSFTKSTSERKYVEAIDALRPSVYPLIKFARLPNNKLNSHEVIYSYLEALVEAGYSVESGKIFAQLPLNSLPPMFTDLALRTCDQLTLKQKPKEALATVASFTYGPESADFLPRIMGFARTMRQSDYFEEAQYVYKQISSVKTSPESSLAILWNIYCDIRSNRLEVAKIAFSKIDLSKVGTDSPTYPLVLLIQARQLMAANKYQEALEIISQSVNRCGLRDEWTPEIFHTAGECYEEAQRLGVARAIYSQNSLFYPKNPYGKKSKTKLEQLPKEENKIVEEIKDDGPEAPQINSPATSKKE